ncbi:uncharacterized protein LOC131956871 [Physella acuta]|uniref:uncharacterized protein LOC131956871 n=1 Tax=Physella acuta TaxID=109671 RepID=UPI0027DD55C1|nr:uncharacterized protein LOC131956871 [Physella acuta]
MGMPCGVILTANSKQDHLYVSCKSNVTFECQANVHPAPRLLLYRASRTHVLAKDYSDRLLTYTIHNVQPSDTGRYGCGMGYAHGEHPSRDKFIELRVNHCTTPAADEADDLDDFNIITLWIVASVAVLLLCLALSLMSYIRYKSRNHGNRRASTCARRDLIGTDVIYDLSCARTHLSHCDVSELGVVAPPYSTERDDNSNPPAYDSLPKPQNPGSGPEQPNHPAQQNFHSLPPPYTPR